MFDFLRQGAKKKIVRTTLYGDQEFTLWEMEVLHTPLVQRLYNLKQLASLIACSRTRFIPVSIMC